MYNNSLSLRISAPAIGRMRCCLQKSIKSHVSHVLLILVRAMEVAPAAAASFTSSSVEKVPYRKLNQVLQFRYITKGYWSSDGACTHQQMVAETIFDMVDGLIQSDHFSRIVI